MTIHLDEAVDAALYDYWVSRDSAAAAQAIRGVADSGGRAGATAGGHLDRIAQLLAQCCFDAGAPSANIHFKMPADDPQHRTGTAIGFTLPGYFRPTKQWDLVVYNDDDEPIICIELKSQNGPSYGNNANNRAEEAIGNAVDFRDAQRAGLIPGSPWIGYVFVIEDDERSRGRRGARDRGNFAKDPVFAGWSYVDRVRILCERLVDAGYYDGAWAVATTRPTCGGTPKAKCPQVAAGTEPHFHRFGWRDLDESTSHGAFVYSMMDIVRRHFR